MIDVWRSARGAGACLKVHANAPRPGHETSPDTNWVKALGLGIRGWDGQFLPAWRAGRCHTALCLASSSDAAADAVGLAGKGVLRAVDYLSRPEKLR